MWSMRFRPFTRQYEMKFHKKTKVLDQEKLRGILWTFVKFREIVFPTFVHFHESYRHSANIRQHLTVFPSYFNNIFLKYFRILQNLMRNYEILRKLIKVDESWQKLQYSMIFFRSNHLLSFHFIQLWCTIGTS
jgi:hypothetical protein